MSLHMHTVLLYSTLMCASIPTYIEEMMYVYMYLILYLSGSLGLYLAHFDSHEDTHVQVYIHASLHASLLLHCTAGQCNKRLACRRVYTMY